MRVAVEEVSLWVSTTWHGSYQVDVDMPAGTRLRDARITRRPPILARTDFAVMGALIDWLASRPGHGLRVSRLPSPNPETLEAVCLCTNGVLTWPFSTTGTPTT